jgi:ubiquinone/menaquinone biosynthesis C-methylase UbiE/uncharacterized protein YbaR (Trm112 family)
MKPETLEILACPACHASLTWSGRPSLPLETGSLYCARCAVEYPVEKGIPRFLRPAELSGSNRRFAGLYDWFSWIYRLFSRAAFAYIGLDEATGRREITDRLDPRGGRVLEVSIGPGVNLPYLIRRPDVGGICGLDISLGQLLRCRSYLRRRNWPVDLFLGNGEHLPFREDAFGGVFHVGGINFFNDKRAAIQEMIRVAAPGARILIADETEKGAAGYEKFLPGFKRSFQNGRPRIVPPFDLVTGGMLDARLFEVWKGWMYCIEFRKP